MRCPNPLQKPDSHPEPQGRWSFKKHVIFRVTCGQANRLPIIAMSPPASLNRAVEDVRIGGFDRFFCL